MCVDVDCGHRPPEIIQLDCGRLTDPAGGPGDQISVVDPDSSPKALLKSSPARGEAGRCAELGPGRARPRSWLRRWGSSDCPVDIRTCGPHSQTDGNAFFADLGHACEVQTVQGLFGPLAIAVICSLLFVEELGVPLPMFPASGLLLVAGVMIAAGDVSPWFFLPIAYVACVGGALLGYAWSRHLGQERLERLADRLRLRRHLDRTAERLHRAGWLGVSIGRVLPGSRVYTSLIAGVTALPFPTFMLGLLGADLVWLGVLVGLGVAVGIPAADYLDVAVGLFLRGAAIVVSVLAALAVLRLVRPPGGGSEGDERPTLPRLLSALGPDVGIVGVLALGVSIALAKADVLTDAIGVGIVASVTLLVYVLGTRLAFASTAGERLAGASYRQVLPALLE